MSSNRGVRSGDPRFDKVLNTWIDLVCDRAAFDPGDAGWWYNERASLSVLAGAVWRQPDGYAFEEYAAQKTAENKLFRGRADLWFQVNGTAYAAEAKQCWPRVGPRATSHIDTCRTTMGEAVTDAKKISRLADGTVRVAMVFASPLLPTLAQASAKERIHIFRGRILEEFASDSIAWVSLDEKIPTHKGYLYPAAFLLLRTV